MASGLFALLDDIATLAKASAASIDDIAAGSLKVSGKTSGVIVDDIAVSPQYVDGLSPKRELPVVWKITKGSLRNKFLIVLPLIMVLSAVAPGVLPFLLIAGGSYLVYEGAEKALVWAHVLEPHHKKKTLSAAPLELENSMAASAIRTDLVLSMEIMLISLSDVHEDNWITRLLMLSFVAILMTVIVYGMVALLVKMDDIGLRMAQEGRLKLTRKAGKLAILAMPKIFTALSFIGTLAMLWVGGHLAWKNLGEVGVTFAQESLHAVERFFEPLGGIVAWVGDTAASVVVGALYGSVLVFLAIGLKNALNFWGGDTMTTLKNGEKRWGPWGAAGVLLFSGDTVLLQLRAPGTHYQGTWGIPGGALRGFEIPEHGALRELKEETGIKPKQVILRGNAFTTVASSNDWSYTTFLGEVRAGTTLKFKPSWESQELRWVPIGDIESLPLHPAFAADIEELLKQR